MHIGHHMKHPLFLLDFLMKIVLSGHIFEKYSNTKFHENPSSGTRDVPCRWMDG